MAIVTEQCTRCKHRVDNLANNDGLLSLYYYYRRDYRIEMEVVAAEAFPLMMDYIMWRSCCTNFDCYFRIRGQCEEAHVAVQMVYRKSWCSSTSIQHTGAPPCSSLLRKRAAPVAIMFVICTSNQNPFRAVRFTLSVHFVITGCQVRTIHGLPSSHNGRLSSCFLPGSTATLAWRR